MSSAKATTLRGLVVATLVGSSLACATTASAATEAPVKVSSTSVSATTALRHIPVKGRAPKTGYTRARFGAAWADVNRNGCDTRNDILRRDLRNETFGSGGCVVLRGTLNDPYTGALMSFVRGSGTSTLVQIDHVVALGDAWQKGAQKWTDAKRRAFANDPLNLRAVNGRANSQKGMSDAASWLPRNKAHRCTYVATQISVKRKYGLWVTAAERDMMKRVLASCSGTRLPQGGLSLSSIYIGGVNSFRPGPSTGTSGSTGSSQDPHYSTCAAAKAAGKGPYRRGVDPEYWWYRDNDNDGVVCE